MCLIWVVIAISAQIKHIFIYMEEWKYISDTDNRYTLVMVENTAPVTIIEH